ncbi:MAG TPA: beta-phosphoglucomutase family hydrolase [Candidatus Goldiibacteriota bacterium]|nr:beta-phosphoglucomutase family hydrolase [Candidatus Goldiibacteriota bacterium]
MAFKGAVFDVDGVVIDTARIHHRSWQSALRKYGIKFTYRDFKSKVDGLPRAKGAKRILPGFSRKQIDKVFAEKQEYFLKYLSAGKIKVFSSTVRLIKQLKKRNIRIAMASSSRNAANSLKKAGLYSLFDVDAEGAYVKRGKPYPDIFIKAARKLGLKPSECVVFEDAQTGIQAAIAAGMKCVGIRREKINPINGADLIVSDLKETNFNIIESLFKEQKNGKT